MIRAWRVAAARHRDHARDGEGARLYGSRWTSPGKRVVCASESLALATLEILVNLQSTPALAAYEAWAYEFDASDVQDLDAQRLPQTWRAFPPPAAACACGDGWLRERRAPVLRVPSALVPHENGYLMDPSHEGFARIAVRGPWRLDLFAVPARPSHDD